MLHDFAEFRAEIHQRLDEMAAELAKMRSSLDRMNGRGDEPSRQNEAVGTEVAESAPGLEPPAAGQRSSQPPTASSRRARGEREINHTEEIVQRGASSAAEKLRKAAKAGGSVRIGDLLSRMSDNEREATLSVLGSVTGKAVLSSNRLKEAADKLGLLAVGAHRPSRRRLPSGFASRDRQDSSGRKHAGPYGRGRRR